MMPLTAQDKEKILSFLESRLEPKVYDTWCRSLELEPAGDNTYRVPTANPFRSTATGVEFSSVNVT